MFILTLIVVVLAVSIFPGAMAVVAIGLGVLVALLTALGSMRGEGWDFFFLALVGAGYLFIVGCAVVLFS